MHGPEDRLRDVVAAQRARGGEVAAVAVPDDLGGQVLAGTKKSIKYVRTAQVLNPETLSFYPRPLGTSRLNPYPAPGSLVQGLRDGASIFGTGPCPVGDVAIPATADREGLAPLIQQYVFRTTDRNAVAAPPCRVQGAYPGSSTDFPQLRAEP